LSADRISVPMIGGSRADRRKDKRPFRRGARQGVLHVCVTPHSSIARQRVREPGISGAVPGQRRHKLRWINVRFRLAAKTCLG